MKSLSIFDIIGPRMIGPSSSHTAGALRISYLARKISPNPVVRAEFTLYGSFARTYRGHGTDRALVAGILGYDTQDVRIRNSFAHARDAGIQIDFHLNTSKSDTHPNTVKIDLTDTEGNLLQVTGVSTGGGNAEIQNINGIDVKFTGEFYTLLIEHKDYPGVAAYITSSLSNEQINIASLKIYREAKGQKAYSIVEADEVIPQYIIEQLNNHAFITNTILIY